MSNVGVPRTRLSSRSQVWPVRLLDDPDPPTLLNVDGNTMAFCGPTVALVGTRRCTPYGRAVARQFAQSLAESGVTVVSGLAKGIDTEAHRGVLDVPAAIPLAVVGSGLNVCYPAQNTALWKQVAVHGAVVSEYDDNAPAAPWQFPRRNRIIAALADVVCVIESHERGGALSTVAEALRRGRTVMAVPGSIRSAASLGTNRLIADGAIPALDPSDVFLALGMSTRFEQQLLPVSQESDPALIDVLSALGEFGAPIDEVLVQIGGTVGQRQAQLQTLESQGKVANIDGWWTPL